MRVSTQALLALLGAAATASASAPAAPLDLAECLNTRAASLASHAACGHAGSIEFCLENRLPTSSHDISAAVLAQCFVNAGCQPDEALIEATWTIQQCARPAAEKNAAAAELRRRKPVANPVPVPTPTAAADANADAKYLAATPLLPRADSTFTGTHTTSLICLTTTTVSTTVCPVQSTGPAAGKTTLSCFSTVALFPTCAAGLRCDTDSALGETTCMKLENNPGAAGIVIAIVFASGLVIAVTTMCFFCCRERRQHSRMAKAAEAAAIARQAAIDSKKPSAGVRNIGGGGDAQPLMPPPHQHQQHQQSQYLPASASTTTLGAGSVLRGSETSGDIATGPNPFADHQQLR
ncbi:hypothetical protein SPBR_08938 [Sporothrix brasiliensis 5110]|uniref:Extracellular membrane protein CFEM domain-containing protein n=1 Tax=Sporothrix brasiliensis 5110 TaxID=1398154 RepID=A0A0C2ELW3_9PEZI|nr:uncharacterized protein SPBR_08938 [Sporothrix brasiliensis 5110]KIH87109.1 hypothetical protein SPBR_08938 [Sporothrix brasiliensis 5110]